MDIEKEKKAIARLQMFAPNENEKPYYLAYSGGKDSDTIKILAQLAGVRYEAVNNHTTVDAPETVYYIRTQKDVKVEYPEKTMWQLIVEKMMPPTRLIRYCCAELKERGGQGRRVVTGVRAAESVKRQKNAALVRILSKPKTTLKILEEMGIQDYEISAQGGIMLNNDNDETRDLVEDCYRQHKTVINPIVDWTDDDVWEFLHHYGCEANPLYQCGFKRIGCIGCPMAAKKRYTEFQRYPKYKLNYIKAFDRMLERRRERGLESYGWKTGKDVFKWWMKEDVNQLSFFDEED